VQINLPNDDTEDGPGSGSRTAICPTEIGIARLLIDISRHAVTAVTSTNDPNLSLSDRVGFRLDDAITGITDVVGPMDEFGNTANKEDSHQS
jgi:hypothetical protein